MIRVFFQGGLANQMFQYAAARCLAERLGAELLFDLSWYFNPWNWKFRLPEFGVTAPTKKSFVSCCTNRVCGKPLFEFLASGSVYREPGRFFDPGFFDLPDGVSISGYFQSEKYFKPIEKTIRATFSFDRNEVPPQIVEWEKRIADSNTVAVHIRRGDYLKESGFHVCDESYYRRAMQWMRERVEYPAFCFFSDDLEWCRATFRDADALFCDAAVPLGSPIHDLRLMAACRHHLIANSSFSWWGAWLGAHPGQQVVAPGRWRPEGKGISDIVCETWNQME